jgi:dTDP-4-dehydrorhamnose reductase
MGMKAYASMRALITGAGGQLGRDLRLLLPDAVAAERDRLSIDDAEAVRRALADASPEVVFNCAAFNGVDAAERDPEPALAANARGPEHLARACRELGVRLVHFSTNYVFDGAAAEPYTENDEPRPASAYARSKREGERRVLDALPSALVIRSSGLYGRQGSAIKGGSFPERILAKARAGDALRVVADQRLNPTATSDLAAASLRLANDRVQGMVHVVAGGCCSWWEFAVETLRLAHTDASVAQATTADFDAPAPRPLNGCLASVRTEPLREWREALADYVAALTPR